MSKQKPFVLVDGSSYLYRAFHALPPLTNSTGQPTGAVYGVLNMLNKLMAEHQPEHVAVVFDAKGKTFRDEMFADYKANRPPMPDELREQVEPLIEAIESMGLPLLRVDGVEADDVIGTLVREAAATGMRCIVSTGDKDMAQLVDERVTLVNTMTGQVLDPAGVREKFDVGPEQIIDYLALVGDSSDNIPGVPKVGPKTAAKWLKKYGDADSIIEHADEIPGKVGESLRDNLKQLELSRKLATIVCDLSLGVGAEELARAAPNIDKLRKIYKHLELNTLLRQLEDSSGAGTGHPDAESPPADEGDYEVLLDQKAFDAWLTRLLKADLVAFDTETSSLNYMDAEIVGVSFAVETGKAAYLPLRHDYPGAPDQLDRDAILGALKPWLEDAGHKKLGHHLKYDAHVLKNHGIELRGIEFDTMLESYVLDSTASRHDMDSLAGHYLGMKTTKYEEVAGKGAKQIGFSQVPLEQAGPYAAEDADVTLRLHQKLWPKLEETPALKGIYRDIEQPLVTVLEKMEYLGVLIDSDMLGKQSRELASQMAELEKKSHEEAGGPFNLGSPKQLQEILFDKLGLPIIRKTPKGQPSTAEDVLQELSESYKLPKLILEYRSLSKLKSTYTDKLPGQINARTGRVHTSYHQAVAATGRLSSSDPNLQNIPIRTPQGRRIRQAFIAPPGKVLLAADYSQIELRIMAHLSGDKGLLDAFAADLDIHRATAAEVFGAELDEVSDDQRRSAKAINFGLMYGMSAFGLARQLGIGRESAAEYVELYFERYPGVKAYMDDTRRQAREQGYVETVLGRRLYLPEINARNSQRRQYAERSAINAPMQGTAADVIKLAMIKVDSWLAEKPGSARLVMQVHDELVLEVDEKKARTMATEIAALMSSAAELKVPLKVDTGYGKNWDEAH
ncbi:MAG: DNA polymerase I [Gammaproteobacteria bacterium]|nr:DNA polymerase I [Gammaproteobacteria bacterium]